MAAPSTTAVPDGWHRRPRPDRRVDRPARPRRLAGRPADRRRSAGGDGGRGCAARHRSVARVGGRADRRGSRRPRHAGPGGHRVDREPWPRDALPGLITDVGSTKREILTAAERARTRQLRRRPSDGRSSSAAASPPPAPICSTARPWLLVDAAEEAAPVRRLQRFVIGLGARVRCTSTPTTHDRTMAYLSHLPQLLAVALMNDGGRSLRHRCAASRPGARSAK